MTDPHVQVTRLREEAAVAARTLTPTGMVPEPVGGWAPLLDDHGNPIPTPPPTAPTDVPREVAHPEA